VNSCDCTGCSAQVYAHFFLCVTCTPHALELTDSLHSCTLVFDLRGPAVTARGVWCCNCGLETILTGMKRARGRTGLWSSLRQLLQLMDKDIKIKTLDKDLASPSGRLAI
jgi:hypothetical protein